MVEIPLFKKKIDIIKIPMFLYGTLTWSKSISFYMDLLSFQKKKKNDRCIHLTVSGLDTITGTTGYVFLLICFPASSKSEEHGPSFEGVLRLHILLKTKNLCSKPPLAQKIILSTT
jgi:hypothetical protein